MGNSTCKEVKKSRKFDAHITMDLIITNVDKQTWK